MKTTASAFTLVTWAAGGGGGKGRGGWPPPGRQGCSQPRAYRPQSRNSSRVRDVGGGGGGMAAEVCHGPAPTRDRRTGASPGGDPHAGQEHTPGPWHVPAQGRRSERVPWRRLPLAQGRPQGAPCPNPRSPGAALAHAGPRAGVLAGVPWSHCDGRPSDPDLGWAWARGALVGGRVVPLGSGTAQAHFSLRNNFPAQNLHERSKNFCSVFLTFSVIGAE